MATVVEETKEELFQRVKYCLSGARIGSSLGNRLLVRKEESILVPSHRPMPKPLLMHPTNHGPFFKSLAEAAVFYREKPGANLNDAGCPQFIDTRKYWFIPGGITFPTLTTNWQLPLRLQIKSDSVNLGTSLIEYRETCKMFQDAARQTVKVYRYLRGKGWKKGRKLDSATIARAQLTTSFGIAPLLNDLNDSIVMLDRRLTLPIFKRFYVKVKEKDSGQKVGPSFIDNWETSRTDTAQVIVQFKQDYGGFTVGNPAELAWEVVPFSFVVDWLIPVGDYLSSLDALRGVHKVVGTLTTRVFDKSRAECSPAFLAVTRFGATRTISPGLFLRKSYSRAVLNDIPLPSRIGNYRPSKGAGTVANALALLRGIVPGLRS